MMKNIKNSKANNIDSNASNQYYPTTDLFNASAHKRDKLNFLAHNKAKLKQQKLKEKNKLELIKNKRQNNNSKQKIQITKQSKSQKKFQKQNKIGNKKSNQSNALKKNRITTEYDLWQMGSNKKKRKSVKSEKLSLKKHSQQAKYDQKKFKITGKQKDHKLSPSFKKMKQKIAQQQINNRHKSVYKRRYTNHSQEQRQLTRNSNAKTPQKTISEKQKYIKIQKYGLSLADDLKDTRKVNSAYNQRISNLNNQIKYYKDMHSKSQSTLQKMKRIHANQRISHKHKKNEYLQQINQLIQQTQANKSNIGHIYTYEQFKYQKMIPESIILEAFDETESHHKIQGLKHFQLKKKGQKIIEYFDNLIQKESEVKQVQNLENLSLISKCEKI